MSNDMRYTGKYLRKRGLNGVYQPSNGWHRKWTYKVGWVGSGNNVRLMAMTDGMITYEMDKDDLTSWILDNDMVVMQKHEMVKFIESEDDLLGNFPQT